jgi:hypothetical protein
MTTVLSASDIPERDGESELMYFGGLILLLASGKAAMFGLGLR